MSDYPEDDPPVATPASVLSVDALSQLRQGQPGTPAGGTEGSPFTGGGTAPAPAPPGQGGGPGGYSTGRVSSGGIVTGGTNPGAAPLRPPGSTFPGSGVYQPPVPPVGGNPPAAATDYAPADGPYLLTALDARLPNGALFGAITTSSVPPASLAVLWLDTSASPAVLRFYDGSQWDAVGDGSSGNGTSSGTGDLSFLYNQASAASTWTITHNLGKYPSIQIVDSAGDVVWGDIQHISNNQAVLNFSAPFTGSAYCN